MGYKNLSSRPTVYIIELIFVVHVFNVPTRLPSIYRHYVTAEITLSRWCNTTNSITHRILVNAWESAENVAWYQLFSGEKGN